ncbi:putative misato segment ii myosin-like domain-containing protein [Rosellinia necatrix]|uniref:Putative misato segment ii myosin-like domain-containing protein n=1 Tax=Rosellinia necatrix TaxID=77044 RepID=A0A1W2TX15_ROSNE|nr:putative misato segment ii myosin-like domain-containing protein [Rosellinia necatrix]
MREIITLQLGQQSNYVATHFWNAQEAYFTYAADEEESPVDHDVHFRPGLGADGTETFMPRTVVYDLKGGFGTLKRLNDLYDISENAANSSLWPGQTVVHRQQPIQASAYQQSLDAGMAPPELTTSTVRYWSDFNRVFYHPRSIIQLNDFELHSTLMPFERWDMGDELFNGLDKEHDLLDRDLRPFVEEADQMQGVQIISGIDDAWGGFAAKYVERIRDEYGKTPVWVFGVQEPVRGLPREKRLLKLVNKARALAELSTQASLVVPLAVPEEPFPSSVHLDLSSPWHVSALFSAAIESTTLYTRLRSTNHIYSSNLGHTAALLNVFGKQTIASIELSPIEPPNPDQDGTNDSASAATNARGEPISSLYHNSIAGEPDHGSQDDTTSLEVDLSSPQDLKLEAGTRRARKRYIFSQVQTHRGPSAEVTAVENNDNANTGRFGMRRRPNVHNYRSKLSYPILDSYPTIFRGRDGKAMKEHMGMRTSLSTDTSVMAKVRGLRTAVIRSIGLEDREMIGNELAEIAEGYKEGWSSGSDDDDDE